MKLTCHSEVGIIKSILLKRVEDAFRDEATVAGEWQALNFLGKPDVAQAKGEYRSFETLIRTHSPTLHFLPEERSVSMDSMYCRDASLTTDGGVILCNMGKPARIPEPEAARKVFEDIGLKILGCIEAPGTFEGGDAAWLDQRTLAVGHTYRTNEAGIRQLENLLAPLGVTVVTVPLPHYKGPSDVFHLMSILSPVDHNLAVVYSPLMPISFRNELLDRGYSFVEVEDDEFDSMACNVLAIAPRECIVVKGNPKTKAALMQAGCIVHEYEGEEISVKGGGGPTCLTRPIVRAV